MNKIGKNENNETDILNVAFAGSPNVGKSSLFNAMTGMRRHTGNWSGKTVSAAVGRAFIDGHVCELTDLPGTYSLRAHSDEERVARDMIVFGNYDKTVVVVDASCLERNLILALCICELCKNTILAVNLIDEAEKSGISIDFEKLSSVLGIAVIPTSAKDGRGVTELAKMIANKEYSATPLRISYGNADGAVEIVEKCLMQIDKLAGLPTRWLALKFMENDVEQVATLVDRLDLTSEELFFIDDALTAASDELIRNNIDPEHFNDHVMATIISMAESISVDVTSEKNENKTQTSKTDKIDRIMLGKYTAYPIMLLLFFGLLWLSAVGANYPSRLLSDIFAKGGELLSVLLQSAPRFIREPLLDGVYLVLTWVVSVMLPPMAIFFPLFTLAEDLGLLPRIAFCLDDLFRRSGSCGKQSLTMCMGLGCNCTGIMGSRIIDSERERLLSILTNSFVPCNGRIPFLITLSSLAALLLNCSTPSLIIAATLTVALLLSIAMTLLICKLLSLTVLRGRPSSFALELPPYRTPNVTGVLVRSLLDRTLLVLGRSVAVAAPAGLFIWLLANIDISDTTPLAMLTKMLDPFGRALGMDGVILSAFLLGLPANEIVLPIMLMSYSGAGMLENAPNIKNLAMILSANGWTLRTVVCTAVFTLFHFPCASAVWTAAKETHTVRYTLFSIILPLTVGCLLCLITSFIMSALRIN